MKLLLLSLLRPLALLLLIEGATVLMVRLAPGYFADPNALDPRLAEQAQAQMAAAEAHAESPFRAALREDLALLEGRLGESRYYQVPVRELIASRWPVTLRLLAGGLGYGWLVAALAVAIGLFSPFGVTGVTERVLGVVVIVLVAIPSGALASLSLASGYGTAVLVIAAFTAPRVYRFLRVLLDAHLSAGHVLYARATGQSTASILRTHLLPNAMHELAAVFGTSLVLALGALIPVEAVFDVPGIAQLALTSALNRDLPVIAATTLIFAIAVALAAIIGDVFEPGERLREAQYEVAG
ncbi:MAG: ABC transporter permease subunit [Acidobacteriota bacterium]